MIGRPIEMRKYSDTRRVVVYEKVVRLVKILLEDLEQER